MISAGTYVTDYPPHSKTWLIKANSSYSYNLQIQQKWGKMIEVQILVVRFVQPCSEYIKSFPRKN